jgi:hypothetical protein
MHRNFEALKARRIAFVRAQISLQMNRVFSADILYSNDSLGRCPRLELTRTFAANHVNL